MKWNRANPVYTVSNVETAIAWYQTLFGLSAGYVNQTADGPNYAIMLREGTSVLHLLRKTDAPHGLSAPVEAQFWIDGDIDELFAKVRDLGAKVVEPPSNRAWGHRDFIVADPDSNLVWITRPLTSGI